MRILHIFMPINSIVHMSSCAIIAGCEEKLSSGADRQHAERKNGEVRLVFRR